MGNNFLISITIIFLILYFPRLIGWFGWIFPQKKLSCEKKHRFALIVPARDEGRAVLPLFQSIKEQSYGRECTKEAGERLFDTYVIVKNPHDEVIEYAKEIDAKVYVDEEQKSKGDCLDYCIRHILMSGRKYDGYMIVDADCRLDADFMKNMNDALESGAQVITARKLVGNYTMNDASAYNNISCGISKNADIKNRNIANCNIINDSIINDSIINGNIVNSNMINNNITNDSISDKINECSHNVRSMTACNHITCQNGLIWSIIDELGNRFKSAMGFTTMLITTGILIRGDLVEEWGGWNYRQTLTEDMELLRDCACKGIRTFHYSYAKLYLEEAPSHADTNKRRTRWMTGMVEADRLYCRELFKRHGLWAFADNYYILSLWIVYAYIGTLSAAVFFNIITLNFWQAAAAFLLIYTAFFALSVMAVLADWKNIGLSSVKKLWLMLMHPFFYMEYIFIVVRAVLGLKPKSWEKIGRVQY